MLFKSLCLCRIELCFCKLDNILQHNVIPDNLNTQIYSHICVVTDEEALECARNLARKEGLLAGISGGTNVFAALKLAKRLGPGKTVVTVLPDTAERYFSTPLFSE